MKPRVLITGASGFIGYHLIIEALKQNLEVYAAIRKTSKIDHLNGLDIKFTYPEFNNLSALHKNIELNKYDYIIHAAGITSAKFDEYYNIYNAYYTYNLARAAADSVKKFVFISSLAAIGPVVNVAEIITDKTTPYPVSSYGRSKLMAEQKLRIIPGLNYIALRPTAVYGPRERGLFMVFKQLANHLELYIGRTEQAFTFIYVKDLAEISINALFNEKIGMYNLCDGNVYDRYQLANITKEILNLRTYKMYLPVTFIKLVAFLSEKIGYLTGKAAALNRDKLKELTSLNWACEIDAAKKDLGFNPKYDLKKGLTETIKWYKEHKWL